MTLANGNTGNETHPEKAEFPTFVIEEENTTDTSEEHPEKKDDGMVRRFALTITDLSEVHPENIDDQMVSTKLGRVILVREVLFLNALEETPFTE